MSLGSELRKARRQAGLSQEELAHRAGLDRSNLSELESDKKSPKLDTLLRLTAALKISAADLVGRLERQRVRKNSKDS